MGDGPLPYLVEPMHWDDVPSVMEIERESFPLPWSSYTYRHELTENTNSHYIVVRSRVAKQHRGKGLGELLLISMMEQAISMRAAMVTLEVRVSNQVAQNLYRKYGFVITGTRPRYYRDNEEDAHIMTVEGITSSEYKRKLAELQAALVARLRDEVRQPAGQKVTARL